MILLMHVEVHQSMIDNLFYELMVDSYLIEDA